MVIWVTSCRLRNITRRMPYFLQLYKDLNLLLS